MLGSIQTIRNMDRVFSIILMAQVMMVWRELVKQGYFIKM